jgi:hypothetical protein
MQKKMREDEGRAWTLHERDGMPSAWLPPMPRWAGGLSRDVFPTPDTRQASPTLAPSPPGVGVRRWVQRLHALLAMAEGTAGRAGAPLVAVGALTVHDDRHGGLGHGVARGVSQRPPGRPAQLTPPPRQARAAWREAGP